MDNKSILDGAGILFFCTDDNTILLLLRSNTVNQPGTWCLPGGSSKQNEEPWKTAKRECIEELGSMPNDKIVDKIKGNKYIVFVININYQMKINWTKTIKLNHEHIMFHWFEINNIPSNLHSPISSLNRNQ